LFGKAVKIEENNLHPHHCCFKEPGDLRSITHVWGWPPFYGYFYVYMNTKRLLRFQNHFAEEIAPL